MEVIDYLSLIQPLLTIPLTSETIEYGDIVYALRNTNINKRSYNTLHCCLIHCLKELWITYYSKTDDLKNTFKQFILMNQELLTLYAESELDNIMFVLKRSATRFNNGEAFQEDDILNEELECNIYSIREIITVSNFIFNMYNIIWLNNNNFISDMNQIISCTNDKWIKLHEAFREFISLI